MLKNDTWIREMAAQGMIQPFEPHLIRNLDGIPQISYGLSSFGYDVRLSPVEFRIFRHIPGTVVDPKNFNPDNLELSALKTDAFGSYFVLPAHSYGLGVALERLEIPDYITVICMGKSTYARCFRGDTRVALVDGTAPTLENMAERSQMGEPFWGYSVGSHGRIIVTLLQSPRYIGRDSLIEVTLDNEQSISCTPDHLFMRRDGRMVPSHQLRVGDSLMPLYRQMARGHEMVYQPLNGNLDPTHRLRDEWNIKYSIHSVIYNRDCQPIDFQRQNNHPWNAVRLSLNQTGFIDADLLPRDRSVSPEVSDVVQAFCGKALGYNHKVVSVKEIPGTHDVYCLTVPETGNFALAAGVFVHNCGIIANVTPGEAAWRGHLTLEFSNSSSADCRIYANEGVVQLLFLEGEPCQTSYADRQGKYQDQGEQVTLARI